MPRLLASPTVSAPRILASRRQASVKGVVKFEGTAPKRFVLLAFDSKEKAQGWYNAPDIKEINAIRGKTAKSDVFMVDGVAN